MLLGDISKTLWAGLVSGGNILDPTAFLQCNTAVKRLCMCQRCNGLEISRGKLARGRPKLIPLAHAPCLTTVLTMYATPLTDQDMLIIIIFQEESEAELEHKARVWIDALLDHIEEKHTQETEKDFQKILDKGKEIVIE